MHAKTRQQLAREYGVNRKTLNRWLKKANIKIDSGLIPPKIVEVIYQTLGYPEQVNAN